MEVRKLTKDDSQELNYLIYTVEQNQTSGSYKMRPSTRSHMLNERYMSVYGVYENEGYLTAAAGVTYEKEEFADLLSDIGQKMDSVANLTFVMVHPMWRGNTYAHMLTAELVRDVQARNIQNLIAAVCPNDEIGKRIVKSVGMELRISQAGKPSLTRDIYILKLGGHK